MSTTVAALYQRRIFEVSAMSEMSVTLSHFSLDFETTHEIDFQPFIAACRLGAAL
jgi:hypothetical protein